MLLVLILLGFWAAVPFVHLRLLWHAPEERPRWFPAAALVPLGSFVLLSGYLLREGIPQVAPHWQGCEHRFPAWTWCLRHLSTGLGTTEGLIAAMVAACLVLLLAGRWLRARWVDRSTSLHRLARLSLWIWLGCTVTGLGAAHVTFFALLRCFRCTW